jgi:hypothetical protein
MASLIFRNLQVSPILNDNAFQHRETHSLKACRQQIAASQLSDILQELENHAQDEQTDKYKELFAQVKILNPLVNNELTEFLNNPKKVV